MEINRVWAMPNKYTFEIDAIRRIIEKYAHGVTVDPFANNSKIASITNDLDTTTSAQYHMDATDFLSMFSDDSVDTVLYDPPYSSRQVSESYKRLGMSVNVETTQASYWRKHKEQIGRIVKPNGIVISCGWNSGGIGKKYGFDIVEILLVAHGGAHNDTIVTIERKTKQLESNVPTVETVFYQTLFEIADGGD